MDYETANAIIKSPEWEIRFGRDPRLRKNVFEQIVWLSWAARGRRRLTPEFHEVWLACAEELRRLADSHELSILHDLHVNREKSWDQVRKVLGLRKSRQALAKRLESFQRHDPERPIVNLAQHSEQIVRKS